MTISQAINYGLSKLNHKSTSPFLDAEVLLAHVLKKSKEYLMIHSDKKLSSAAQTTFTKLIKQRSKGIPVAYLVKNKSFYGLDFYVDKNVLVPRPVTEELVDLTINIIKQKDGQNVLDIGTGSGCIAVSLAKHSKANFFASDVSASALKIAKKNAYKHKAKILFKKGSLLAPWNSQRFDIIIANLPYGWSQWKNNSSADTIGLKFEPASALFTKEQGLYLIRQLLTQISLTSLPPHAVILEYDPRQTKELKSLIKKILPQHSSQIIKDYQGNNRFALITKRPLI
jgi:release factor glutamine methyltransferase